MMRRALRNAPVAAILSEEAALPETSIRGAALCGDRSARWIGNLENNISVGTIFSIRPRATTFSRPSLSPARRSVPQVSWSYGPQTTLVLAHECQR